jgi:5-methyltetrahydropteroyltriglutamate--homocysteine methyltransferase
LLRSTERIVTSHAGALEQPEGLRPSIKARDERQPYDEAAFNAQLRDAVAEVVRSQLACGLDSVCDGEFGKQNFTSYVGARIGGFEPRGEDPLASSSTPDTSNHRDNDQFPGYYARRGGALYGRGTGVARTRLVCTGPLRYAGQAAIAAEIANLQHGLAGQSYGEAFLPAVGPGILSSTTSNEHYPNEEAFLAAIADAMHDEYRAIVDAGFLLQVDDPYLLSGYQRFPDMSVRDYQRRVEMLVATINRGLAGIPPESVRLHTCWGSWLGPHTGDVPLRDVAEIVLQVNANEISIEASNPQHEPDWRVWEHVKLPPEKVLMPGVVGHFSDFIEAPELVADRLVRYARLVGRENVVAGTDCGLRRVGHPEIAWAKFRAMAEGARLATKQLWG